MNCPPKALTDTIRSRPQEGTPVPSIPVYPALHWHEVYVPPPEEVERSGHVSHEVAPTFTPYVPAPHVTHDSNELPPEEARALPIGQPMQSSAVSLPREARYLPVAHPE